MFDGRLPLPWLASLKWIRSCAIKRWLRRIDRSDDAAVVWSAAPVTDVLLAFQAGTGTVLPAIAGFIDSVTMDEGALVSVSYEPMDPSQRVVEHLRAETYPGRWAVARAMAPQLRETRALIAAMSQAGTFRLDAGGGRASPNVIPKRQNTWHGRSTWRRPRIRAWQSTRPMHTKTCR
jgi:hypothetical protein